MACVVPQKGLSATAVQVPVTCIGLDLLIVVEFHQMMEEQTGEA